MQLKSTLAGLGLGMVAGAAAVLMLPKQSEPYQIADEAAQIIKQEAGRMLNSIRHQ